jgi:hypothetical protein
LQRSQVSLTCKERGIRFSVHFASIPYSNFPQSPKRTQISAYWAGRGLGVGRILGVGVGRGVTLGVAVGLEVAVAVGVGVGVALGVAAGVAVGVGDGVVNSLLRIMPP